MAGKWKSLPWCVTTPGKVIIGLVVFLAICMIFRGYSPDAIESLFTLGLVVFLVVDWLAK